MQARECGVHSGMPLRTAARKCPDAVFLPSDPPTYEAASAQVMAALRSLARAPARSAPPSIRRAGRIRTGDLLTPSQTR